MAGGALAPIQTSTRSAGRSARLASAIRNRREELTVSPASRRRTISRASSKAEGRIRMLAPITANRARRRDRLVRERDRWFESVLLQRGVYCEPVRGGGQALHLV